MRYLAIAATDANALRAVSRYPSERGQVGTVDDLGKVAISLSGRGVEADDAGGVVVHLQQLGGVGVPVGHRFEDPVEPAEVAG
jgi:hypothetical protein